MLNKQFILLVFLCFASCQSAIPITSPEKRAEMEAQKKKMQSCANCRLFVLPGDDGLCPECKKPIKIESRRSN